MSDASSVKSIIESTIKIICTEENRETERERGYLGTVEVINFFHLINHIFDNPELKEMYMTDPQFHTIIDYISKGVTASDLISLFKTLCKTNNDLQAEILKMMIEAPPKPIIIKK